MITVFSFSYTWSFEKIHLSMVMVITGQLVCSYDEEFRRLYARSTLPLVHSKESSTLQYLKDPGGLMSATSSQLSLHQIHMKPRGTLNMRSAQEDRFANATLTKGLSVQERLHQFHCPDLGSLVRGHSYGGELHKLNPLTRLRMGTKDIGASVALEKHGPGLRDAGDLLLPNRLSQQELRHQDRYGADQTLIPFNSESSLHRWKMNTYLNEMSLDASCDMLSPVISPYSSHTGLNEQQSQLIHSRSRDIKSRMEEIRQKRLSLQDYTNLRQSQEALRYPNERPTFMSSSRGLDMSVAELQPNPQTDSSLESTNHKDGEPHKGGVLADVHRSTSYYDVKTVQDRKTTQTYDWNEPLLRTTSAGDLHLKLKDSQFKLSHLQSSGHSIQLPKGMKSLTEIPEEKEGSNTLVNSSDSAAPKHGQEIWKNETTVQQENLPAEYQNQVKTGGSHGPTGKAEGMKSVSNELQTVQNSFTGLATDAQSSYLEKGDTYSDEQSFLRKNSLRKKVYSFLTSDEKKASKKEDKSFQRKPSLRSKNTSGINQPLKADHSQVCSTDQITKKSQSPGAEGTVYQRQKVYSRFEYLLTNENISKDRSLSPNRHESSYAMYQTQSGSDKKLGKFMQRVGNLIGKK